MRVAMYMPGLEPASLGWQIYQDFAAAMRDRGLDFDLLTSPPQHDFQPPEGTSFLPLNSTWETLGQLGSPLLRTPAMLATVLALGEYLKRQEDLDVLYVEIAYPVGVAAALAQLLSGWQGKLVLTPMGEDILVVTDAAYGFRRFAVPRWLVRWALRRANAIRCISPLVVDVIDKLAPRPARRVIPLNVTDGTVAAASRSAAKRLHRRRQIRGALWSNLDLMDGRKVVLSLGRLHPFKGIDVLISALPLTPDVELLIAGPTMLIRGVGDVATSLVRLAQRLGVADRVHIVGPVAPSEVQDLMSAVDAVVVPSHQESLNRVCVEAAAAQTPVVVTETTGIAGFMPPKGLGKVVPARSPEHIAKALKEILSGELLLDPAAAREFVERFSAARVAAELSELLRATVQPSS